MISSSFTLRMISALVLAPLTLGAIIYGGMVFKLFVGLAFGISVKEWMGMARLGGRVVRDAFVGVVYLFVCFAAFLILRLDFDQGLFFTICLLVCIWSSDIAAYFSGKLIGGPKLAEKISPNKTWAGLIGGMVGSALAMVALNHYAGALGDLAGLTWERFAPFNLALIIGASFTIFGQMGDLLISRYKRKVGVKDTGNLIPGHGGILDRIDSLLFVSPIFLVTLLELS